jgi:hypothetical protein
VRFVKQNLQDRQALLKRLNDPFVAKPVQI